MTQDIVREIRALEAQHGLTFTDYARYGCYPGKCKCPTRFPRCRAWVGFESAIRAVTGEPEPEPQRVINKWGQDVTGQTYPSKRAAMHDIFGSTCD